MAERSIVLYTCMFDDFCHFVRHLTFLQLGSIKLCANNGRTIIGTVKQTLRIKYVLLLPLAILL